MKRYIYLTTLCLLGFYASYATNYTWNGSVSNNWATANNWTPAGVPSSGDSVTIDAASYTPVLDMNRSIQLLTVNSGGELDLNGQTLSVSLVSNLIEARLFNGHLESNDFAAESCIFNVSINVSAGFLQINSNRFNYPVHIIYIGSATSENGGNSFLSTVDILSNSIGNVLFGHENSDIFEDSLKVKVQNAGRVVLADSSEGNIFNGYCFFERLNGSSGAAITIGRLENSAYFNNVIEIASNSSSASITSVSLGLTHCFLDTACIVQVHTNGFNQGLFRISNSIISSAIGITLSNEAGFMAEKESTFRESIQVSAPHIYLHNAHFRGESSFTKTGGGIDFSQGPITANRDIIFTNTGGGDFWINGSKGDMFHANVTLNNTTKGGSLMFSAAATESFVEGDVMINSTRGKIALATSSPNSLSILGKVYINADSGSVFIERTTIEQDGSIEIQSIKGNIHFAGLQYNAVAPFNVNLINGNGFLAMKYCNFQPKVNLTLPSVAIAESVFNDSLTITSGVNGLSSWGGLICHGPVVLNRGHNTGAWNLYGNGHPNTFFKNVEINVNDTNSAPFNFNGQHQFYENLIVHSSQPLQASQSHWSFKGANNQQVNLECDSTIQLEKLSVEKSNGLLTLNNDIAVLGELSLTKGVVRVAASANLQLLSLTTVSGGSDSSYVEGFMSKQGTAAFTFPTGGNGSYAPLGIDAVASTCTFKAQYIAEDPDSLYPRSQKDTTLGFINRCGYWNLDRTTGTQNTKVTLGWSNNPCFLASPVDASVALWDGYSWKNKLNATYSGTSIAGEVKSTTVITSYPAIVNLAGVCNFYTSAYFSVPFRNSQDTVILNVSPRNGERYEFYYNDTLLQTGGIDSLIATGFIENDTIIVNVSSFDGCSIQLKKPVNSKPRLECGLDIESLSVSVPFSSTVFSCSCEGTISQNYSQAQLGEVSNGPLTQRQRIQGYDLRENNDFNPTPYITPTKEISINIIVIEDPNLPFGGNFNFYFDKMLEKALQNAQEQYSGSPEIMNNGEYPNGMQRPSDPYLPVEAESFGAKLVFKLNKIIHIENSTLYATSIGGIYAQSNSPTQIELINEISAQDCDFENRINLVLGEAGASSDIWGNASTPGCGFSNYIPFVASRRTISGALSDQNVFGHLSNRLNNLPNPTPEQIEEIQNELTMNIVGVTNHLFIFTIVRQTF